MVTADERMKILQMLQEGKINPEAAAQLLEALGEDKPVVENRPAAVDRFASAPVQSSGSVESGQPPRWLRVRVTDTNSGRPRVNVRMPISLVNLGLKLGAKYSPEIEGIDVKELLEAAQAGGNMGTFVDVYDEEDGEHVEVFLE